MFKISQRVFGWFLNPDQKFSYNFFNSGLDTKIHIKLFDTATVDVTKALVFYEI